MIKRCPKCNEPLYTQHIDKIDKAHCHHCGYEGKFSGGFPISNADRIRGMGDEELAEIIMCPYDTESVCKYTGVCLDCCLKWLKQPEED